MNCWLIGVTLQCLQPNNQLIFIQDRNRYESVQIARPYVDYDAVYKSLGMKTMQEYACQGPVVSRDCRR